MKTIFLILLTLFSTLALAAPQGQREKILGYLPSNKGLTFQVASGGCTLKTDFTSKVEKDPSNGVMYLTLIRLRPDVCYPFIPMGVRFDFSYEELGITSGDNFVIANPNGTVQAWAYNFPNIEPDND
jgi:hypothetical protein